MFGVEKTRKDLSGVIYRRVEASEDRAKRRLEASSQRIERRLDLVELGQEKIVGTRGHLWRELNSSKKKVEILRSGYEVLLLSNIDLQRKLDLLAEQASVKFKAVPASKKKIVLEGL